jgi:ech hydrogenase subunit B
MKTFLISILYVIGAPIVGGLLAGIDRKISARMQSRVGPPIVQPFYDVFKLFNKENLVVRRSQNLYITFFFIFIIFTGWLFFTGGDLLLVIFALTLAGIFFVLAGYKASSPYSFIGAERELLQMMAYEPMVILAAVAIYMVTGSFYVADIVSSGKMIFLFTPAILAGFVFILLIKFRKSPFDLSMSHHAHQELVKGLTTEFSGRALALIEIAHWYEHVFLLGFVYIFFAHSVAAGICAAAGVLFFMILVDNTFARVKWRLTLESSWVVALVLGMGNILVLHFFRN